MALRAGILQVKFLEPRTEERAQLMKLVPWFYFFWQTRDNSILVEEILASNIRSKQYEKIYGKTYDYDSDIEDHSVYFGRH